jgi:DNA-binding NtrC family response regulator
MVRVPVVEHDPQVRQLLSAVVEGWGHKVTTAADGEAALGLVASFRPEAVVLDLGLPDIGVEVPVDLGERECTLACGIARGTRPRAASGLPSPHTGGTPWAAAWRSRG